MKLSIVSLLLFVCYTIQADEIEFGKLRPIDLETKECAFEKDAAALIMFDKGNSWFVRDDNGFVLRFDRHIRIKIFKEAGFDYGEIEIPLFIGKDDRENVKDIEAFTFNIEDGAIKKYALDNENVFKEDINEYWYAKKFAMPQLKEGSIIDVKYSVYSPFYDYLQDWEFQSDIPTLYSEYKVNMIPFYSYRYRLQGASKMDHFKSYEKSGFERTFAGIPFKDMVYEFGLKNVPSFKDEEFISSRNDYLKKIDFQLAEVNYPSGYKKQLMESWPALADELLDSPAFGKYIKKAEKWGKKNLAHLNNKPAHERMEEVLNYMKSTYAWNGYTGKYRQRTFKEFNDKLTGNSANINLFAIGALNSIGIKASPVIISTRSNGKVTDSFPYASLFNYVIILVDVDGKKQLVDATQPLCPNNLIPAKCINGKGFVVEEESEAWVNISNRSPSMEELNLSIHLNVDENEMTGRCLAKSTGYMALSDRKSYRADKKEFEDGLSDELSIVDGIKPVNLLDNKTPFKYSFDFTGSIDQIDNQLIVAPFADLTVKDNPFKQENRSLPIDLVYLKANRLIATIGIPEGYRVDELPAKQNLMTDNVAFSYSAVVHNNQIQVVAIYKFKKITYDAKAYKELKNFMKEVTSKVNAKIILTKVDEGVAAL